MIEFSIRDSVYGSRAETWIRWQAMAKDQEIDTLLGRISELELVVKERNGDIQSLTQQRSALQAEVTSWKAQTEQLAEFKHAISALVDPTGHSSPLPRSTLPRVRSRGIQSLTAMLDDSVRIGVVPLVV
jgi:hypothetical protein